MNLKTRLKMLLREIGESQNELYYKTGFHFEDVKTKEDFNDIVRIFSNYYPYMEKYYIEEE